MQASSAPLTVRRHADALRWLRVPLLLATGFFAGKLAQGDPTSHGHAHHGSPPSSAAVAPPRARAGGAAPRTDHAATACVDGAELDRVIAQVEACRGELDLALDEAAEATPAPQPWQPPERATLVEWARDCEVRWNDPAPLEQDRRDAAGLDELEARAYEDAYGAMQNATALEQSHAYEAAYGQSIAEAAAGSRGLRFVLTQAAQMPVSRELWRWVAEERAGLRSAPALERMLPGDRWTRAELSRADVLERELAARLGAQRARELRERLGGWPGEQRRRVGCG